MKSLDIIVDLQYGSTGKGLLAGYLAEYGARVLPDTIITAWGPNAGHTYIDRSGNKFVNIALPNGIVSPNLQRVLLGPGSVINPEILHEELNRYSHLLDQAELLIHPHAAVVTQANRDAEAAYGFRIGSTMKGVGEAMIQKIRRDPMEKNMNIAAIALRHTDLAKFIVSHETYAKAVDKAEHVMIEGAQGFSLSINHGFYPYTTSRDCTVFQLLADCGVPREMGCRPTVWGSCRTYPIRVANRFKDGVMVGTSGPCYPDQQEIDWLDIGLQPELTTVTKLPRRVFTFSKQQIEEACRMNGVDYVFLNFCNYLQERDAPRKGLLDILNCINNVSIPKYLGWGPTANDMEQI